jgi:branched-chain amino acid transport system permease protein
MQEFLQQVVSGLATGGIYASLALALVLIYNAMGLVNFAQGEMAMFATYIAFILIEHGFGALASYQDLGVIAVSGVVLVLIYLLLQRTTLGLALRAASQHPEASRLLGIRVSWMLALGWGLASAVGAVSGMMAAPALLLQPNMMQTVIIYAFAAAVLGGIESPLGAVVGGLIIGVTVNLAGAYVPGVGGDLQLAVAFAIIIAVLVLKPNGLFGRAQVRRV